MSKRKTSIKMVAPMARPQLRKKVREALMALPQGRRITLKILTDLVNELLAVEASADEVRDAVNWNHDQGFVGRIHNDELEQDEWYLTKAGREHEMAS